MDQETKTTSQSVKTKMHTINPIGDAFVKMHHVEEFDEQGVKLVARYFNMPTGMCKVNYTFQREIQEKRVKDLTKMIKKANRFWSMSDITIDMDYEIINGNHRNVVAGNEGILTFPIVNQLEFVDLPAKVNYFIDSNRIDPTISAPHYLWRAKMMSQHIDGLLLYQLANNDTTSLLFDYVSLAERKPLKTRITINSAWHIIMKIGLKNSGKWEQDRENHICDLINESSYDLIKGNINAFMCWFKLCFGEKNKGRVEWSAKILQTYAIIWRDLIDNNLIDTKKKYNQSVAKFQGYTFLPTTMKLDQYHIRKDLAQYYNKNKRTENSKIPIL